MSDLLDSRPTQTGLCREVVISLKRVLCRVGKPVDKRKNVPVSYGSFCGDWFREIPSLFKFFVYLRSYFDVPFFGIMSRIYIDLIYSPSQHKPYS